MGRVKRKRALEHAQNAKIQNTRCMRKVSSGLCSPFIHSVISNDSVKRTMKVLIRLCVRTVWSEPSMSSYARTHFRMARLICVSFAYRLAHVPYVISKFYFFFVVKMWPWRKELYFRKNPMNRIISLLSISLKRGENKNTTNKHKKLFSFRLLISNILPCLQILFARLEIWYVPKCQLHK